MQQALPTICFVAPNAFPLLSGDAKTALIGGAELQQIIVARGLAERGYTVKMICLDFGQEEGIEIDGIRVIRAFKPEAGIPVIRFVWPRLTSLWACLERADTDIYYQRTAGMLTGLVAHFCRLRQRKSIFAAAGNPDLQRNTPRIAYARDRWIYEYGLRNVDRIVVQNDEQARLCRMNFGRESVFLPNCYPVPVAPAPARAGTGCILWVSTVRSLKQPGYFLDLAEALPKYRFRMIGGPGAGEDALFRTIKERAKTIPNVEFLGFVPYADADRHFDDAAVFVNTSESEGFPNTFLQAWARGIPVVSFVDCGAMADGVPVAYQVDDVEEMARQIAGWFENEVERSRAGDVGQRYFKENHSPARVLDLYEEVFGQLMTERLGDRN